MIKKLLITTIYFSLALILCTACDTTEDPVIPNNEIIALQVLDNIDGEVITGELGDGETTIVLKAKIPYNADTSFREVIFKASDGTFVNTNNAKEYRKTVDTDGYATAYLTVPLAEGNLYLTAEITDTNNTYSDEKIIELAGLDSVLNFEVLDNAMQPITNTVRADSTTVLTFRVTANALADRLTAVKFWASAGNFINENPMSVVFNDNNEAIVKYKVPQTPGEVYFTATSTAKASVQENYGITFARAYADYIIVEPSAILVNTTNNSTIINTYLKRYTGLVSKGTVAHFEAFELDDTNNEVPVGRFTGIPNASTNTNETITGVTFIADTGDVTFGGTPIYIRVTTLTDDNIEISETITLNTT